MVYLYGINDFILFTSTLSVSFQNLCFFVFLPFFVSKWLLHVLECLSLPDLVSLNLLATDLFVLIFHILNKLIN